MHTQHKYLIVYNSIVVKNSKMIKNNKIDLLMCSF